MSVRDTRYQAAVVVDGRLLLLRCATHGGERFWVLPGGEAAPGGGEGVANLIAVCWLALDDPGARGGRTL